MLFVTFALFFYFLVLLQTSFLVHFDIAGAVPNLILISIILFNFFEKSRKNTGFLIAAIGGFYLDLFSNFQIGVSIFSLILLVFLIKKFLKFIGEENIFYFISLFVFSLIFYNLFLFAFNSVFQHSFYFSFNDVLPVLKDGVSFGEDDISALSHLERCYKLKLVELGYNLVLGILAFCFVRLCFSKKLEK